MSEAEDRGPAAEWRARFLQSEREKELLLDELESAYEQMSAILADAEAEQRVTYAELQERNQELKHQLDQVEAINRWIQEAQRMLLQAERLSAMGQLAAAIVHEIRNPLTAITSQVEMLLHEETDERKRKDLNLILTAIWRLSDLVENILSFARRRNQKGHLANVNQIVVSVEKFLAPLNKNVSIETVLERDLPGVEIEAVQLEQVLTNFLMNAFDAIREGNEQERGQVRIETGMGRLADMRRLAEEKGWRTVLAVGAEERDEPMVYIEVCDDGLGIPPSGLEEIFETFFTTKESGTGLGLAISRGIAMGCKGEIMVASREGEGSSFRIMIPAGQRRDG